MSKIIHMDLFSGIGGFAYAVDQVFNNVEHIFCEINPYCQQVLKKHWKGSKIYGDIRQLTADAEGGESGEQTEREGWQDFSRRSWEANWLEVATELCGVDDGLPVEMDGFKLTKAGHRVERLKALGNAIVPQVAIEILRAIKNCGN